MKLSIINGHIIDPANDVDESLSIHVNDSTIIAVGNAPKSFSPDEVIDANNQWVIPGIVDLAVQLREPGFEQKATIASELTAAAAAGVTTLCCLPNTNPVIDTAAVVELIQQKASLVNDIEVLCLAALTKGLNGKTISEMASLKQAGCIAVTNTPVPIANTALMYHAYQYAASLGLTVFIQPQDYDLGKLGCVHDGEVASRLGLPGMPDIAESAAVALHLELIAATKVKAHFCRLSTYRSVELLRQAKAQGLAVTADVAAHQLFLTEMDIIGFNTDCYVNPPLRSRTDQNTLLQALKENSLQVVCSDHQPHEIAAKNTPIESSETGIAGIETLLPLMLRLYHQGHLTRSEVISKVTSGPAAVLELPVGSLTVDGRADICIVDPNKEWVYRKEDMLSQGCNSPFDQWTFQGKVCTTISKGNVIYNQ